ncbi:WhiB family transcriptional regulator [Kitasatospora sp. GP82]|uniref:WhiB family transcriptional regulator n=1 Tax=Kitasatospora sp. GP82 TaxID=3035089 RepID=UPI002474053D|nr:WhiB family transcriptional regulator [Kitasatospora sp. GP82]MDH6126909.1 hypothetical protein [Kitasatospora sp. GP82]
MARIRIHRFHGTCTPSPTERPAVIPLHEITPDPEGDLRGAACTALDPDLFFPEDGDEWSERRARMVCAGCPVRAICLDLALTRNEKHGIFGGLNAAERRALKNKLNRAARLARAAAQAVS